MIKKLGDKVIIFLIIFLLSAGIKVFASEDGFKTHDGFFLRMLLGPTKGETNIKDFEGEDYILSGTNMSGVLQLGLALTDNVIFFGEIGNFSIFNPDLEWGNQTDSAIGTTLNVRTMGGGISYYFMPINMYFSVSLLSCKDKLDDFGEESNSERGLGTTIVIGKEWWVSANWGLGVSGVFHYSKVEWETTDGMKDVENRYYGIAFSATYN